MAQGSHVMYATPASISARLEGLFQFVADRASAVKIDDPHAKTLYMIRLGAFFFSEFLLIHPFSDGNGRTARLLLNALLAETVVIPFSLFHESRQKFIDVLEKRNDHSPPSDLARFILIACNKTASDVNWQAMV
jgi:Fic family protein